MLLSPLPTGRIVWAIHFLSYSIFSPLFSIGTCHLLLRERKNDDCRLIPCSRSLICWGLQGSKVLEFLLTHKTKLKKNPLSPNKSVLVLVQQGSAVPRSWVSWPNRGNQVFKNLIVQNTGCPELEGKGASCRCSVFNRVNSYCF